MGRIDRLMAVKIEQIQFPLKLKRQIDQWRCLVSVVRHSFWFKMHKFVAQNSFQLNLVMRVYKNLFSSRIKQ